MKQAAKIVQVSHCKLVTLASVPSLQQFSLHIAHSNVDTRVNEALRFPKIAPITFYPA